jgi:hypothetical protein
MRGHHRRIRWRAQDERGWAAESRFAGSQPRKGVASNGKRPRSRSRGRFHVVGETMFPPRTPFLLPCTCKPRLAYGRMNRPSALERDHESAFRAVENVFPSLPRSTKSAFRAREETMAPHHCRGSCQGKRASAPRWQWRPASARCWHECEPTAALTGCCPARPWRRSPARAAGRIYSRDRMTSVVIGPNALFTSASASLFQLRGTHDTCVPLKVLSASSASSRSFARLSPAFQSLFI